MYASCISTGILPRLCASYIHVLMSQQCGLGVATVLLNVHNSPHTIPPPTGKLNGSIGPVILKELVQHSAFHTQVSHGGLLSKALFYYPAYSKHDQSVLSCHHPGVPVGPG